MIRYRYEFKIEDKSIKILLFVKYQAHKLELTGWIKPSDDGRYIMEIQGKDYLIETLIYRLKKKHYLNTSSLSKNEMPNVREKGFYLVQMKRYHYIFKGRVQGVGFRFTAIQYANQLGLTGWVRNNYDGSVEMEVQGEEYTIQSMIQHLRNDRYIRIDSFKKEERPLVNESGFGLKSYYQIVIVFLYKKREQLSYSRSV